MPDPLIEPIRQAVAGGQFQLAERLWNRYAGKLKEDFRAGLLTAEALAEAGELVAWSRLHARRLCAHAQARLSSIRIAGAYGDAAQLPPSSGLASILRTCF